MKTIANLKIVKVDSKNGLLCINGSLPGSKNSIVRIYQRKRKKF